MDLTRPCRIVATLALFVATLAGCPRVGLEVPRDGTVVLDQTVVVSPDDGSVVDAAPRGDLADGDVATDDGSGADGRIPPDASVDLVAARDLTAPVDLTANLKDLASAPDRASPPDLTAPVICSGVTCGPREQCVAGSCVKCGSDPLKINYGLPIPVVPDIAVIGKARFAIAFVAGDGYGVHFVGPNGGDVGSTKSPTGDKIKFVRVAGRSDTAHLLAIGTAAAWRASANPSMAAIIGEKQFQYTDFVPQPMGDIACPSMGSSECPALVGGLYNNGSEIKLVRLNTANTGSFDWVWYTGDLAGSELKDVRLDADGQNTWAALHLWSGKTMTGRVYVEKLQAGAKLSDTMLQAKTSLFSSDVPDPSGLALGVVADTTTVTRLHLAFRGKDGSIQYSVGKPAPGSQPVGLGSSSGTPVGLTVGSEEVAVATVDNSGIAMARIDAAGKVKMLPVAGTAGAGAPQLAYDSLSGYFALAWLEAKSAVKYSFVHSGCVP